MKRITIGLTVTGVVGLFALGVVPYKKPLLGVALRTHADEGCSVATLQGSYGAYGVGTVVPAGTPFRSLVRLTFDGHGNWSNSLTQNDNGTVIRSTASGTYTVNGDCTGTIDRADGQSFDVVIVDGGKEFYGLRTNPAHRVLTLIGKKQSFGDHEEN
ncbi:MAG TPA: hypothetical protein VGS20_16010 [Candidatus Acidoferrales bacterium]|nr:hypothetical protein [Candidatus Acidoferrales bacterium]